MDMEQHVNGTTEADLSAQQEYIVMSKEEAAAERELILRQLAEAAAAAPKRESRADFAPPTTRHGIALQAVHDELAALLRFYPELGQHLEKPLVMAREGLLGVRQR